MWGISYLKCLGQNMFPILEYLRMHVELSWVEKCSHHEWLSTEASKLQSRVRVKSNFQLSCFWETLTFGIISISELSAEYFSFITSE